MFITLLSVSYSSSIGFRIDIFIFNMGNSYNNNGQYTVAKALNNNRKTNNNNNGYYIAVRNNNNSNG